MLGFNLPLRRMMPSLAMRGATKVRGEMEVIHKRRTTKLQRVHVDGAKVRIGIAKTAGDMMLGLSGDRLVADTRTGEEEQDQKNDGIVTALHRYRQY